MTENIIQKTTKMIKIYWPASCKRNGQILQHVLKNNLVHHPGRPSSNQRVLSGLKYFFANDQPGSLASLLHDGHFDNYSDYSF